MLQQRQIMSTMIQAEAKSGARSGEGPNPAGGGGMEPQDGSANTWTCEPGDKWVWADDRYVVNLSAWRRWAVGAGLLGAESAGDPTGVKE